MRILFYVSVLTLMVFSCNTNTTQNEVETSEAVAIEEKGLAVSWIIDQDNSGIEWWGSKPTGVHNGTIDISSAHFKVENGAISSGKVVIDMSTIKVLDMDEDGNYKLGSHLRDGDFFETNTHPTASFEFIEIQELTKKVFEEGKPDTIVSPYKLIVGNLGIKDSTKKVYIPGADFIITDSTLHLESDSFTIDRTNWGITYKSTSFFSELGEKFIHDNIGLKIKIKATR